jgi:CBS domain-containing protein
VGSSAIAERVAGLLDRTPPFDRLPPGERRSLLGEVVIRYFEPGEVILQPGQTAHDYLCLVESGVVRLTDAETRRLVDECGEGDVFGSYGLVRGGPLPYEARVVEPAVCCLLGAERFRRLYEDHDAFAAFFDSDLSAYIRASRVPLDASGARLLFGTRLGEVVRRDPVICSPGMPVREAARAMRERGADAAVVVRDGRVAGVLSDADLRNRVVAEAAPAGTPVELVMNRDVVRLREDAPVFEALMAIMQRRAEHVVVTDGGGSALIGVVSDQDITRAQGHSPAFMVERIERAGSASELQGMHAEKAALLIRLYRQGVQPDDLITINTEINDRLMLRVLALVEEEAGTPPLPWAWLSLGSEGRREMSLLTDQDNALIYADPASPGEAEAAESWFRSFAERANAALAEAGFALCAGEVMARNPRWRRTLSGWKETFRRWVLQSEAQELMEAGIFFDLRGLYGEGALVEELKAGIAAALERERLFLPFMVRNALSHRPPLSFFRRFVLDRSGRYRHTFDVKAQGLRPVVDLARAFAMQVLYLDSANTADRLRHVARTLPEMRQTAENALDAYNYLSELRFVHHLEAIERGEEPNNRIDPDRLTRTQQSMLKVVFQTVQDVQSTAAHRYGLSLGL